MLSNAAMASSFISGIFARKRSSPMARILSLDLIEKHLDVPLFFVGASSVFGARHDDFPQEETLAKDLEIVRRHCWRSGQM